MIDFISNCMSSVDCLSLPLIVEVLQIVARCCAFGDEIRRIATYVKRRRSLPASSRTAENPGGSLEPKTSKLARSKARLDWRNNAGRVVKQLFRLIRDWHWLIFEIDGGDFLYDITVFIAGCMGY